MQAEAFTPCVSCSQEKVEISEHQLWIWKADGKYAVVEQFHRLLSSESSEATTWLSDGLLAITGVQPRTMILKLGWYLHQLDFIGWIWSYEIICHEQIGRYPG